MILLLRKAQIGLFGAAAPTAGTSTVKAHQSRSKTGGVISVREHQRRRRKRGAPPTPRPQGKTEEHERQGGLFDHAKVPGPRDPAPETDAWDREEHVEQPPHGRDHYEVMAHHLFDPVRDDNQHRDTSKALDAFDKALAHWDGEVNGRNYAPWNRPKFNRKALLAQLDELEADWESQRGKLDDLKPLEHAGLRIFTTDQTIQLTAHNMVSESVEWRRRALSERDRGGKHASTPAQIRREHEATGFHRPAEEGWHNLYVAGSLRFRKWKPGHESRDRGTAVRRASLANMMADAEALPESHRDLFRAHGVEVHLALGNAEHTSSKGAASAGIDRRGRDVVTMMEWSVLSGKPGEVETGTSLAHELGHIVDNIVMAHAEPTAEATAKGGIYPHATDHFLASLGHEVVAAAKDEPARRDVFTEQGGTYRGAKSWAHAPGEWFAEAYRYAYRDGGEMKTTLQADGFDHEHFRGMVDALVERTVANPKGVRNHMDGFDDYKRERKRASDAALDARHEAARKDREQGLRKADQIGLFGGGGTTQVKAHQSRTKSGAVTQVRTHRRKVEPAKLWERFGPQSAPKPGEKGYRAPREKHPDAWNGREPGEVAQTVVANAIRYMHDPTFMQMLQTPPGGFEGEYEGEEDLYDHETQAGVADLLGLPSRNQHGVESSPESRTDFALWAYGIAQRVLGFTSWGDPEGEGDDTPMDDLGVSWDDRYKRSNHGEAIPKWIAEAVIEDALHTDRKLRLCPLSREEANAFVAKHHSALPDPNTRTMFAVGLRAGGRLVAVATAGHPGGPWKYAPADAHLPKEKRRKLPQTNVLELHRVASDGTMRNAASMLTSRMLRLAPKAKRGDPDAPWLFVTYQLASEAGSSYKALRGQGLRPVVATQGKKHAGGARGTGHERLGHEDKIRWEAGPAAGPADWALLAPSKQQRLLLRKGQIGLFGGGSQEVTVKTHSRRTATGKVVNVLRHQSKRKKAAPKSAQSSLFGGPQRPQRPQRPQEKPEVRKPRPKSAQGSQWSLFGSDVPKPEPKPKPKPKPEPKPKEEPKGAAVKGSDSHPWPESVLGALDPHKRAGSNHAARLHKRAIGLSMEQRKDAISFYGAKAEHHRKVAIRHQDAAIAARNPAGEEARLRDHHGRLGAWATALKRSHERHIKEGDTWTKDASGIHFHRKLNKTKHADAIQASRDEYARIPASVRSGLDAAGIKGQLCEVITDALPHLKGKRPRGWAAGSTWDMVKGGAGPNHFTFAPGGTRGSSRGSVFLHELGHACDRLVELGPEGKRLAALPWFDRWYSKARKRPRVAQGVHHPGGGVRRVRSSQGRARRSYEAQSEIDRVFAASFPNHGRFADYVHQPGRAGRQEFLAEAFAVYFSGEKGRKLCEEAWPGLMEKAMFEIEKAAAHVAKKGGAVDDGQTEALAKASTGVVGSATMREGRLDIQLRAEHGDDLGDAFLSLTPGEAEKAGWRFADDPHHLGEGDSTHVLDSE